MNRVIYSFFNYVVIRSHHIATNGGNNNAWTRKDMKGKVYCVIWGNILLLKLLRSKKDGRFFADILTRDLIKLLFDALLYKNLEKWHPVVLWVKVLIYSKPMLLSIFKFLTCISFVYKQLHFLAQRKALSGCFLKI